MRHHTRVHPIGCDNTRVQTHRKCPKNPGGRPKVTRDSGWLASLRAEGEGLWAEAWAESVGGLAVHRAEGEAEGEAEGGG
eukprot:4504752-Prymnesium_polylepis.1